MLACHGVEAAIASPTTAAKDEARAAGGTNEKRAAIALAAVNVHAAEVPVLTRIEGERAAIDVGTEAMTESPSTEAPRNRHRLASLRNPPSEAVEDLQSDPMPMTKILIWPSSKIV